jgi:hypothetical protein
MPSFALGAELLISINPLLIGKLSAITQSLYRRTMRPWESGTLFA